LPVICKKDGLEKLRRGAIYTRSRRLPETVEVPSQAEMRELLDLAIEKGSRTFTRQAERMGFVRLARKDQFIEQLKGLPETEIIKKIWSMGRWRVWIRPSAFEKARFQSITACRQFVLLNAVSCDGWQYPLANENVMEEGDEWIAAELDG